MPGRTLNNKNIADAKKNTPDLQVVGDGDAFQLICKASSVVEGFMKSTKAMEIPYAGCLVQVTTQQRNNNGSYVIAEALTFAPNTRIDTVNGIKKIVYDSTDDFGNRISAEDYAALYKKEAEAWVKQKKEFDAKISKKKASAKTTKKTK